MYVKLFASILDSSIWSADAPTRLLWITMLAMADEHGMVYASLSGLANRARLTIDECDAALAVLSAPDPESRTPDHEGRRVERVRGGWLLLNYAAYREIRTKGQMAGAARQARYRENHRDSDSASVTRNADDAAVTEITTTASASASVSDVVLNRETEEQPVVKEAEPFDPRPFEKAFGEHAPLVIELIRDSHKQAAVAASIWRHTLGSYCAGMGGTPVAHADVIGVAVASYLANMKPGDAFVDRLFSGYVRDAIRRLGAGEQRERAKREDSHVDRERSEEEQRQREEQAIVAKIAEFKRTEPEAFATYSEQAERAVHPRITGIFRAPTVRAKLIELIDKHGAA